MPYLTDAFGDAAVEFVDRYANGPFFLMVSFTAPHPPMHALDEDIERFTGRFEQRKRVLNAAMVYRMDANIAKVIEAVSRRGLADETMFIFTNDNGGGLGANGASNAPYRGIKGSLYEGGIRVPLLMSWRGSPGAGRRVGRLVSGMDILPMVIDAAGLDGPSYAVDGRSLLPFLNGADVDWKRPALFWRSNWTAAVRDARFKLIRTPADDLLLFDLLEDPGETTERSADRPAEVERLRRELDPGRPAWCLRCGKRIRCGGRTSAGCIGIDEMINMPGG